MTVWGVYQYWPTYDFADADDYPIMRSFGAATQRLRDEPSYGRRLPTTLQVDDADWSHRSNANASWCQRHIPWLANPVSRWHAWMLLAPETGSVALRVTGRGTGRVRVEVDGESIGELSSLDPGGTPLRAELSKGAHALRVVLVDSELELDRIEVGPEPAL